jgi:hypothetical protein
MQIKESWEISGAPGGEDSYILHVIAEAFTRKEFLQHHDLLQNQKTSNGGTAKAMTNSEHLNKWYLCIHQI